MSEFITILLLLQAENKYRNLLTTAESWVKEDLKKK